MISQIFLLVVKQTKKSLFFWWDEYLVIDLFNFINVSNIVNWKYLINALLDNLK